MRTKRQVESQAAPAWGRPHPSWRQRRQRKTLVAGLRMVARKGAGRGIHRHELLLLDRAAAVRTTVLQIAALLDQARLPDPEACVELDNLLRNGSSSPSLSCTTRSISLPAVWPRRT